MALVTGNYVDNGGEALPAGMQPRIEAVPSKPTVTLDGRAVSARPQSVSTGADGSFSLDLIPTVDAVDRDFFYTIRGFYLEPNGYDTTGYKKRELFEYKLPVPTEGGPVGELLAARGLPFDVWVFVDPSWTDANEPTAIIPGAYYLSADLDNPDLGTGDLWKASA